MMQTLNISVIFPALIALSVMISSLQAASMLPSGDESPPKRPYQLPGQGHYESFSPATNTVQSVDEDLTGNWFEGSEYDRNYRNHQANPEIDQSHGNIDREYTRNLHKVNKKRHESRPINIAPSTLPPSKAGQPKRKGFLSKLQGKFAACGPGGLKLASPGSDTGAGEFLSGSSSERSFRSSPPQQQHEVPSSMPPRTLQRGFSIGSGSSSDYQHGAFGPGQGSSYGQPQGFVYGQMYGQPYPPQYGQSQGPAYEYSGQDSSSNVDNFFRKPYSISSQIVDYKEPRDSLYSKGGKDTTLNPFHGAGGGMLEDLVSKAMSGVAIEDQPTGHRRSHSYGSSYDTGARHDTDFSTYHGPTRALPLPPLRIGSFREVESGGVMIPHGQGGKMRYKHHQSRKDLVKLKREARKNAANDPNLKEVENRRQDAYKKYVRVMQSRGIILTDVAYRKRFDPNENDDWNSMMLYGDPAQQIEAINRYNTRADGTIADFATSRGISKFQHGASGSGHYQE